MRKYSELDEEEKQWRRRDYARTLAEAEAIKADKESYAAAKQGAAEILAERTRELEGLVKVAGNPKKTVQTIAQANRTSRAYDSFSNPAVKGRLF